jgi:hypothetical protein
VQITTRYLPELQRAVFARAAPLVGELRQGLTGRIVGDRTGTAETPRGIPLAPDPGSWTG